MKGIVEVNRYENERAEFAPFRLYPTQRKRLADLAKRKETTQAEIVRDALDAYLDSNDTDHD